MHTRSLPAAQPLLLSMCCCLALLGPGAARAQVTAKDCGPLSSPGQYGPYDFTTDRSRLDIVERFHFGPKVEGLIAGMSGDVGGDLSYTLVAFPNHHRALAAILTLGARTNQTQPRGMSYSIECHFERAVRFRPKDTVVRGLFAIYLGRNKRLPEAIGQLQAASEFAGDNALSHHNIGLVYFDLGQFEQALAEAHLALKLGHEGTALIDKLKTTNHWKEPTE
jgi:hypothetical protein